MTAVRLIILLLISVLVADAALVVEQSVGANMSNVPQTNSVATWNVETGDLLVLSGAFNVGDNLSLIAVSADTATVGAGTELLTSGVGAITEVDYYPVTASGTLALSVGRSGTAYTTYGLYLLRADSGDIEILGTPQANGEGGATAITSQYSWSGSRDGILIEGVAAYEALTLDSAMTPLKVNNTSLPKRGSMYQAFSGLSSLETVYTPSPAANASVVGIVFSEIVSGPVTYEDVPLTSSELYVQGAKFVNIDGNGMNFHRFDFNETLTNVNATRAKTTSGVILSFYTRSDTVKLNFAYNYDPVAETGDENRNSRFGVYQNGAMIDDPYFAKTQTNVVLTLTSQTPGALVKHDVVLPNWSNPILSNMQVESGEVLESGNPYPAKKIVVLGDSISHGTGQGASYLTYPYMAADMMDMELFNLAVGGGKIAPEVADLLGDFEPVDAIWVLVGYNDWQGASETLGSITNDYETMLATIRTHQPNAQLFCSTLTYTTNTNDLESGVTDEEVRDGVSAIVNARIAAGDAKLHLVQGDDYSDASFLNDPVHFSEPGAAMFATNVVSIMRPIVAPSYDPYTGTNVLFIAIDDINPILGCYGNDLIQTPNIDALAERGMLFSNAHCQYAVCGPSRASLMLGLMPEQTGVIGFSKMRGDGVNDSRDNALGVTNLVTIPQHFVAHGYDSAASGKINDYRCVGSINADGTINEDGGQVDDPPSWSQGFVSPGGVGSTTATRILDGETNTVKLAAESVDQPATAFTDGAIATEGLAKLNQLAAGEKPFFLGVGFKKPHLPFLAPKSSWDLYQRDDFTPHPFQTEMLNVTSYTFNGVKEMRSSYYLETNTEGDALEITDGILPDDQQKLLLHGYYACISHVDDQVGRVLGQLDALGLSSNTIVVLWGDHGFHLGDHNEWGKHTHLEQASRVPFIISAPGFPQGQTTDAPVDLLDIYPTLCDLAGLPVPVQPGVSGDRPLSGDSLVPILSDPNNRVKEGALNTWGKGYAYRTERYRYTEWIKDGVIDAQELYDYQLDPMETTNLAVYAFAQNLMHSFSVQMRVVEENTGADVLLASAPMAAPVNDDPVFTSNPLLYADASADEVYAASLAGDVSDPNDDPLTISISGPGWLTATMDGALSGTPTSLDAGTNVWTVTADDGYGGTATAELQILVIAGALPSDEITQIENEFGITLTPEEISLLAEVVNPETNAQWRIDAEARIEANRKVDMTVKVVDSNGTPVPNAEASVKLRSHAFKWAGTFSAKDFAGVTLPDTMTTNMYQDRLLSMFNSVGLNNGFKPRLTSIHAYLPDVLSWGQANNIPVRGHLCIWPGTGDVSMLDDTNKVAGVDYGGHLSQGWGNSDYADGDVLGAVVTYRDSARMQADKDILKAEVDAEIANWAGNWDVYEWDVINETLSNKLLMQILGYQEMAEWFKITDANKVNPNAKLVLNDYQIISAMSEERTPGWYTNRRDAFMANINRVIADGGPIDMIGFQSRIKSERRDPQLIWDRLEEWGNAYPNLEMVGTEFEVVDSDPGAWKEYIYTDLERSQITEEMMMQYFSHPLVSGFTAWAVIGNANANLMDYTGRPHVNGLVWYYLHRIRFMTEESGSSDANGLFNVRAFKGDYDVVVSYEGSDYPVTATMLSNGTVQVVLNEVTVPSAHDVVFEPEADTYVDEKSATSVVGGTDAQLKLKGKSGQNKVAYLRFEVSGLGMPTELATLRVYNETVTDSVTFYQAGHTQWQETDMNWNNRPALGTAITNFTPSGSGWVNIDVSSVVTTNGSYTFAITHSSSAANDQAFTSKEGLNAPQLVVFDNAAPVFTFDPVMKPAVDTGVAYSESMADDVTDAHNDAFTLTAINGPAWLTVSTNGLLAGVPMVEDVGTNSWDVQAVDAYGAASTGTVQVVVTLANQPPSWTSDPFTTSHAVEDTLFTHWINYRASDPEGDALTYALISGPSWLTLTNPNSGRFDGTPTQANIGLTEVEVSVTDGTHPPVHAIWNLVVDGVNDAPVFVSDPIVKADALEDMPYSGSLAADASDEEGDEITFSKKDGPDWLTIAGDGILSGTPVSGDLGLSSFTVQAVDGNGGTNSAVLEITVTAPPPVPMPGVLQQVVGYEQNALVTNDVAATLNVQPGDLIAIVASGNNNILPNSATAVTVPGISLNHLYTASGAGPKTASWYGWADAAGSVDVQVSTDESGNLAMGIYLFSSQSGAPVQVLEQVGAGTSGATSLALTYDWTNAVDQVMVVESAASYGVFQSLPTLDANRSNSDKFIALHDSLTNVTGRTVTYTVSASKPIALAGIAVYAQPTAPITETPESYYQDWLVEQGYTSSTNLLDDADADGVNNLVSYAIGGAANLPEHDLIEESGTNYMQYVYVRWNTEEATARGLSYSVESSTNLTDASGWTIEGIESVGFVADQPETGFNTVTNRLPMTESAAFMRLEVEFVGTPAP